MEKRFAFIVFLLCLILKTYQRKHNLRNDIRGLKEEELNELKELSDDIIILHTNDVHCGLNEKIGYDGLYLYKRELQRKYKHVLLVDAGDHIQGGAIGILSKGSDIIDIMNKIGYDVVTIGNHEFDYGINQLTLLEKKLNCGYISANYCYRKNKAPIFSPYKIIDLGEKKIAFIGITTPQTLSKTYLHNIVDEDGNMLYDFLTENDGKELYDTIQGYIDEVKREGADHVILLCHLGNEGDSLEQYTSNYLISNLKGVDALVDGHTHRVYNITSKDKEGKDVIIAQTGTKLANLGMIKIQKNGKVTSEMLSEIPPPEHFKYTIEKRGDKKRYVDVEMHKVIKEIINSHNDELNEKIGYTDFDLKINIDDSGDSSKQISRSEESILCDLVADAIRNVGEGDISMINAGSIRTDLMRGNITFQNVLDILPFSADIIIKEVSGQDVLDALEYGMKNLPDKTSRFPQVSGISFKVNITFKSSVIVDDEEMFVKVDGKRRVYDVKVGNEPLDLNKIYKMSFGNYIADGGDGFSMFKKYEEKYSTLKTDNQAFMEYIKDVLKGKIPEQYKKTQGRIIIVGNEKKEDGKKNSASCFIKHLSKVILITSLILIFF
jgi:2',3'-cyclic-nucleotide 2'-phosphodiesterase (5'-nucleotidase family)